MNIYLYPYYKMDIDTQCFSVFKSFTSDIIKVFPEYEESIQESYGSLLKLDSCKIEEQELLREFLGRVHKLNKKITNKDESMFGSDPLILTNTSFKELWAQNISYKTKETIWKYLQTFCLLDLNHRSNKDLLDALSDLNDNKTIEITDKKVASDVKKIKKMTENIKDPIAEEVNTPQESEPNPFADMEQMMNSSEIGKIAKEVSESLDIESLLSGHDTDNPMDIIQKLMSGDAMSKIMGSINNIVNDKVESGELNKGDMVNEAQDMCNDMGSNPLFKAMSQMTEKAQPPVQKNNVHQSNKTQTRLKKKLKEKQKVQVNKVE